jgi:tetratricopeptide (TPR) repeat protein
MGRLDEALSACEAALRLRPDFAEAHTHRGNVLGDMGRLGEAVSAYEAALRLRPDFAEAHRNRGNALRVMGRLDEALSACEAALRLRPDFAEAHNNRGNVLGDMVRLDEALAAYEADLAPYLAALAGGARFPGGLYTRSTAATLAGYRTELGEFYRYATTNDPPVPEYLSSVRGALEGTANPGGKLLACFMTPPWEVLITTTLRREAQRSALCGLLAWRIRGNPARWSEVTALLPAAPADPFSAGPLLCDPSGPEPRVWSVYQNGQDDGGPAMIGNQGQPADLVWRF